MRVESLRTPGVLVVATAVAAFATYRVQAQTVDATTVLAEARQALGGAARIDKVHTFIVTGRTRQVRGDNLVPIEFEIQVELPDRYARRDEFPAQDAGPSTSGFTGDALIQMPAPPVPPARAGGPPPPTAAQLDAQARARVVALKQDFARLVLGMFASAYRSYPLAFSYAGDAEAPQGKARVLDATGPSNFTARLFIDAQTHLPLMVTWPQTGPPGPRRGGAPASPPPGGAPSGGPPPAVEHRLYFADYRDVDGLKLPFRLRHAVAGDTVEETSFDRFRINARVDPRRFEPAS